MNVLVVLIPVSLILGLSGLIGFLWTIRTRQYEDPLGEASRILLEADTPRTTRATGKE
ncbi:MAG: cbb3-type cytochrome oxidase assembly protein CcoS [Rhodobacteraceae bacterium]|nr:cbb3-type cytochrome oxidase assembly protein CcoS [Paracoccaceae bacterium]